jgi:asparagine N-glycosylation enzyme membrane subunit Stt3
MNEILAAHFLEDALAVFRQYKQLGENAMAQMSDAELFATIDAEANSVAVIVKHLAGNMRSRWTNFLTTDGEKPDRQRDAEFIVSADETRAEVMRWWETGWESVFAGHRIAPP